VDKSLQSAIDQTVQKLVRELKPKQVYLFGSTCHDRANADSDIDLLVVVADSVGNKITNTQRAYRATRDIPRAKDIIVDHESTFKKRAGWVSSVEREVLDTGRLVYEG
jgi:predicted nucleotidyltransferase